jgi:hypothetical protein
MLRQKGIGVDEGIRWFIDLEGDREGGKVRSKGGGGADEIGERYLMLGVALRELHLAVETAGRERGFEE